MNFGFPIFSLPRAVGAYGHPWQFKPDPMEALRRDAEEKDLRERQRREEERLRREEERLRQEREERERREREKEKEEKARKEAAQREREQREQRERERERREKECRETAERERLLRLNERSKMSINNVQRDRSPLRNGNDTDVSRIKEEPKREEDLMLRSNSVVTDPRYHQSVAAAAQHHYLVGRHAPHMLPPPHLSRAMAMQMAPPQMSHFPQTPPGWPPMADPFRDAYRLDPMHLRYASAMESYRVAAEEERNKALFAAHSAAHLRAKEPSPIPAPQHHRMNPNSMKPSPSHIAVGPNGHPVSVDLHKKEESPMAR